MPKTFERIVVEAPYRKPGRVTRRPSARLRKRAIQFVFHSEGNGKGSARKRRALWSEGAAPRADFSVDCDVRVLDVCRVAARQRAENDRLGAHRAPARSFDGHR